ncbi:MAG: molybdopterin molybdotransferase MoeA [Candidatus Eisenbacteria bacterium]|nr:molybdopterin molybdotransferase MoeA [Candidatus Eisenbacteria bacterium]
MSDLLSVGEARAILAAAPLRSRPTRVALASARGHVLARAVRSDRDLPPFDRAAVDGYAIRLAEPWQDDHRFRVVGSVAAGERYAGTLRPGTAVRIMTGAPVPRGADGVVMVERSELLAGGEVRLQGPFAGSAGRPGLAARGEDARRGDQLLPRGRRLEPADLAVLASVGCIEVPVVALPRVAMINTGPEVVRPDVRPGPTQIRNSNGPLLRALLEGGGLGSIVTERAVGDTQSAIVRAIRRAEEAGAEVILLTGGVSMGDFDLVPAAVTEAGYRTRFHRVALRPGKPLLFATAGGGRRPARDGGGTRTGDRGAERAAVSRAVFGLPGNPVSVLATAWEFVLPYLRAAAGRVDVGPFALVAEAPERIARKPGLTHFVLASLSTAADGALAVREVAGNGSGDFVAAARANAIVPLEADHPVVEAGARCVVHPLYREGWGGGSWQ